MNKTFFFYDLETSGLSARNDRIMQFAGQRTDIDLNPIGEPINILVKLSDDTLPSPQAIAVTKITPQQTRLDGIDEPDFCRFLMEEVFTPKTIAVGYNSVRFDDEFMRFLFWRNFYDPYEWHWKDERSRWDLLDVVRMVRALRPDGINWPVDAEGKATNRLELLTVQNNISHEAAHDALSDVQALIDVARLIKKNQPKMFDFLLAMRDKKAVMGVVNPCNPQPFVYTSGRYPSSFEKTTVAVPVAEGRHGNIIVYDLRYDIEDLLSGKIDLQNSEEKSTSIANRLFPALKELAPNKCPAVAPLGVLEMNDAWGRIQLDRQTVLSNLKKLSEPNIQKALLEAKQELLKEKEWISSDAESALYDGFLSESDQVRCNAVRNSSPEKLADFMPDFTDERLPRLLINYKGRNFPKVLSAQEKKEWEKYRITRLNSQIPNFLNGLKEISEDNKNRFIFEELNLWYQNLAD